MARVLITGGAGFIGSRLAVRLISEGHEVLVLDNLSRAGSCLRLDWLRSACGRQSFEFCRVDITDAPALCPLFRRSDWIFHLAGQTALALSIRNPRLDFEANALGTLNVLEAARLSDRDPIVIYSSSNKVYGKLSGHQIRETESRYELLDLPFGVAEDQPLDFQSPYGCSKGAGDQYVLDYARIYGLRTVVMRQSCIYGPWQLGSQDQGWLAWFLSAASKRQPITVFGNGKQVRDVLFVEDLLDVYLAAISHIDRISGSVYNIGGGPQNSISIWMEFRLLLEEMLGHPIQVAHEDWRPGDQRMYISDIRKATRDLGWTPRVRFQEGIRRLGGWLQQQEDELGVLP